MQKTTIIKILIFIVCVFIVAKWLVRRDNSDTTTVVSHEVTLDTIQVNNVKPVSIETSHVDSLPIYHFRDTVDGRWSAEVRGDNVEMRSLVLVDHNTHTHSQSIKRPEWEVSMLSRVGIDKQWVGLGVEHNVGAFNFSVGVGYDFIGQNPSMEAQMGIRLWGSK